MKNVSMQDCRIPGFLDAAPEQAGATFPAANDSNSYQNETYANPSIMIMDKATTDTLDADTEYILMKSLRNRDQTQAIMAHSLGTIRNTDSIAAPEQDQFAQQGSDE